MKTPSALASGSNKIGASAITIRSIRDGASSQQRRCFVHGQSRREANANATEGGTVAHLVNQDWL